MRAKKPTAIWRKRARSGSSLPAELTADERGIVWFGIGAFDSAETLSQRKVLFSYLVGRVIEDMAPNSIVAQSAMSAYYDELQRVSGETYGLVSDSAALSLYILAGRSSPDDIARSAGCSRASAAGRTTRSLSGTAANSRAILPCTAPSLRCARS